MGKRINISKSLSGKVHADVQLIGRMLSKLVLTNRPTIPDASVHHSVVLPADMAICVGLSLQPYVKE